MRSLKSQAGIVVSSVFSALLAAPALAADPAIKIGSLASISGPMSLPESSMAAKAVFDRINAAGGIQGRQIEYLVQDDKGDAGATAQAARDLVDSKGVVAFAGSASLQDCSVNANLYRQRQLLSIPGVAGDVTCFRSSSFAPVNAGPARGTLASLVFASEQLKKQRVCAFLLGIPAHAAGNKWATENFKLITGKSLHLVDTTVLPNDDMTPHVLKAKNASCDAIVFSGTEQMDIAWNKAMRMQGISSATQVYLTPAYTSNFAALLGKDGDGIYSNSEYEPFLADAPALADWRKLMAANKIPESSFAQGGYLAATILAEVMKGIQGPITRESVTAALRKTQGSASIKHPMIGLPFSFAEKQDLLKTTATKFMRIKDGKWETVTPNFLVIEAKN